MQGIHHHGAGRVWGRRGALRSFVILVTSSNPGLRTAPRREAEDSGQQPEDSGQQPLLLCGPESLCFCAQVAFLWLELYLEACGEPGRRAFVLPGSSGRLHFLPRTRGAVTRPRADRGLWPGRLVLRCAGEQWRGKRARLGRTLASGARGPRRWAGSLREGSAGAGPGSGGQRLGPGRRLRELRSQSVSSPGKGRPVWGSRPCPVAVAQVGGGDLGPDLGPVSAGPPGARSAPSPGTRCGQRPCGRSRGAGVPGPEPAESHRPSHPHLALGPWPPTPPQSIFAACQYLLLVSVRVFFLLLQAS